MRGCLPYVINRKVYSTYGYLLPGEYRVKVPQSVPVTILPCFQIWHLPSSFHTVRTRKKPSYRYTGASTLYQHGTNSQRAGMAWCGCRSRGRESESSRRPEEIRRVGGRCRSFWPRRDGRGPISNNGLAVRFPFCHLAESDSRQSSNAAYVSQPATSPSRRYN